MQFSCEARDSLAMLLSLEYRAVQFKLKARQTYQSLTTHNKSMLLGNSGSKHKNENVCCWGNIIYTVDFLISSSLLGFGVSASPDGRRWPLVGLLRGWL